MFKIGLLAQYCHHKPGKGNAGRGLWAAVSILLLICPQLGK